MTVRQVRFLFAGFVSAGLYLYIGSNISLSFLRTVFPFSA